MVYIIGMCGLKPCLTETFFELNLVTRVDMLRGEICCESGGVNGRDKKLDWNYVHAARTGFEIFSTYEKNTITNIEEFSQI